MLTAETIDGMVYVPGAACIPQDSGWRWHLGDGDIVQVSEAMIAQGLPHVGDFFVRHNDGSATWVPRLPEPRRPRWSP